MQKYFHVYRFAAEVYGVRRQNDNIIEAFQLNDITPLIDVEEVQKCEIIFPLEVQDYIMRSFDLDKHRSCLLAYLIMKIFNMKPLTAVTFGMALARARRSSYVMGIILDE